MMEIEAIRSKKIEGIYSMTVKEQHAQRVLFWGTYDLSKPRTRILLDGLKETGVSVTQLHADVWPEHKDKSLMTNKKKAQVLFRAINAYPRLIWKLFHSEKDAIIFVPYMGLLDVLVLWPFAKVRRQKVVWDMFFSIYDTVVNDRRMISAQTIKARVLKLVERLAGQAADLVLLDTQAHADYIVELLGLPKERVTYVQVGAEAQKFPRVEPRKPMGSRVQLLFYGQLIPLHGIETIVNAALSKRGRQYDWHIVGTGQDKNKLQAALEGKQSSHIRWEEWVPYEKLINAIREADICLGIFGASRKAACVVPNKVFQSLLAGRSVITRVSPAMTEVFGPNVKGIKFTRHSDPEDLLDAIELTKSEGFPQMPEMDIGMAQPHEVANRFLYVIGRA